MDNAKKSRRQSRRPGTRRLVQLYSALLYNAHLQGFVDGEIYVGKAKYACVPGFNCYSCPGAVGACPLGALQNALSASGHRAGWYILGILLLFGITLGRTICGWLCPVGLIQELLHKIPTPKIRKSAVTRALSYLRYVILAVFVIALPLWYGLRHDIPLPGFCKYICPAGTFEGAMGLLSNPGNAGLFSMLGVLFTRKFIIMLVIGLVCVFCYRAFCRFICPLGAIYGLFNRFCIVGVRVDRSRCSGCGACVRGCRMDIRQVGDAGCIHCGQCMDTCSQNAISIKAGRCTLKAPAAEGAGEDDGTSVKRKKMSRVIWGAALAVLCFALVWFNFLDPSLPKDPSVNQAAASVEALPKEEAPSALGDQEPAEEPVADEPMEAPEEEPAVLSFESDAPIGYEVGMQLGDFTIPCIGGTEFRLADTRGKVVFLNLWATYCTPCVQELPHFSELYKAHEGDIAMLAVHSSLVTDDVEAYLSEKDWAMPFAIDTDDDTIFEIVGGSSTLPQTIVLNRRGEVVYNQKGSITAEMLGALYALAEN